MAARNGYAQDFDLIDVPGYSGMPMRREAALQLAGACAEFWMETGIRPAILEAGRSIATQQRYWKTMPPGTAAYPGSSNHGWYIAADMGSPLNSYDHPLWAVWDRIARKWGFNNDQGRATKSRTNPRGESWHYVYVGSPQLRATGREMADMANLVDTANATRQELGWLREQQDAHVQKQLWMADQADRLEGVIGEILGELKATRQELTWHREQADRDERKTDELLDKSGVKSRELRAPAAPPAPTS